MELKQEVKLTSESLLVALQEIDQEELNVMPFKGAGVQAKLRRTSSSLQAAP